MFMRIPRATFTRQKGVGNRRALKKRVAAHVPPGVIGYIAGAPVAWCSIGPREEFHTLARSRVLQPVDEAPVWSVVCFLVARPWRRQGVSVRVLEGAVEFARSHGATIVEGYPNDPKGGAMPDTFAWTGLAASYLSAGFTECARRSPTRPIMRRVLRRTRSTGAATSRAGGQSATKTRAGRPKPDLKAASTTPIRAKPTRGTHPA